VFDSYGENVVSEYHLIISIKLKTVNNRAIQPERTTSLPSIQPETVLVVFVIMHELLLRNPNVLKIFSQRNALE
jgi:hypothetical protein